MNTMADERRAREAVLETARQMHHRGLVRGTSGNVSCRWRDGMLITPTALPYDALAPEQVVVVDADGTHPTDGPRPSSEWRLHLAAYRARPERTAVVHCHSRYATAHSCLRRGIPAVHYLIVAAGGADIPCVEYQEYGSERLAGRVAEALATRDACLLAHHGQVAIGRSLDAALDLAESVEDLAMIHLQLLPLGDVPVLSEEEVEAALRRYADYR